VRVRAWAGLQAKVQNHATKGTRGPKPIIRGTLVLVEVSRLAQQTREPQGLWWQGLGTPDLDLLWRAYVRRFDQEYTVRFVKHTLGWTTPRVRHPEQADHWTWLVLLAYIQLRLARPLVAWCSCGRMPPAGAQDRDRPAPSEWLPPRGGCARRAAGSLCHR
jgi:hypothetical protein